MLFIELLYKICWKSVGSKGTSEKRFSHKPGVNTLSTITLQDVLKGVNNAQEKFQRNNEAML